MTRGLESDNTNDESADLIRAARMTKLRSITRLIADLPIRLALWFCDRIAGPSSETEADRAREREEAAKVVPPRSTPKGDDHG